MGIEPTTSGLDLPLLCRLSYEAGQRKSGTIKVVNRGEEKVRVHMNVVPRSTSNGRSNPEVVGSIPTEVKRIFSLPRVVP